MYCRILTITQKMPSWLETGFTDYVKRFADKLHLQLIEIPLEKRGNKINIQQLIDKEGERILAQLKPNNYVIALDVKGELWSTDELANNMKSWQQQGQHVDFLIGGPDGLAPSCLQRANAKWSLSRLTFPHHLVRLLLAEQLYRANSILIDHPYHR